MPTHHTLPLLHKYNPNLHSGICSVSEKIVKGRFTGQQIFFKPREQKTLEVRFLMLSKNKTQVSELPGYLTCPFLCSNKYI